MTHDSPALSPQRVETILDSIADGVFTVDPQWRITSMNRAAEQITGFSRDETLGQKCFDVFRANICQTHCALRETIESGKRWVDRRVNIINRQGEQIPLSISTAVLRDEQGQVIGGVETFRDLSALELLRKEIDEHYTFQDIISKNHRVREILNILPDIASSDCTVLIEGPTGSGKELFAKAIHNLSQRAEKRCVAVNCGALPDTLLESELFGYKKGAFTGASQDKPGRYELAEGGTLFLDEIGDISTALQVKLLRVLQQREYEPLGGTEPVKADVRVITATNKPLADLVARGAFREDLFYRLNVVKLVLPSLAQRREDIPLLVDHFIRQFNAQQGKQIEGFSEEAMGVLLGYDFPGNVRQLSNVVEYAAVLCRSAWVGVECLPPEFRTASDDRSVSRAGKVFSPLRVAEVEAIVEALRRNQGHRGKTAAELNIDKTTLWRKMKRFGITYP